MRLIDADAIRYEPMLSAIGNGQYEDVMVAYKDQIDDMPTIEERKTGKWIWNWDKFDYDTANDAVCSKCKNISAMPVGYFCKWCGADMRGTP